MAAEATVGLRAPRAALSPRDKRALGWAGVGAGVAVATIGVAADSSVLLLAGATGTVAALAVLAPQLMLAVLLFAGVLKASGSLSGLPIDLTVVTSAGVLLAMTLRVLAAGVPPLPPATALAAGLAALVVLSLLWTPGGQIGMDRALRFETLTMIAFIAPLVLVGSREELRTVMTGVVALALVIALNAVETGHPSEPLVAAGGNQIVLALYSAMGLFACIYLALIDRPRRRLLWLVPPVAIFIPTILAAGSRGVLIGSTLALLVAAGLLIARSRNKGLAIACALGVATALAIAAPGLAGEQAGEKYSRSLFGGSDDLGVRPSLLAEGWELAIAHPMGIGVGGYPAETGFVYPHNSVVEVAAEQGIIAVGLFLALIFAAARSVTRGPGGVTSPEAIVVATFLVLVVTESMFSNTYTQDRALWFTLGLALAVPRIVQPPAERGP